MATPDPWDYVGRGGLVLMWLLLSPVLIPLAVLACALYAIGRATHSVWPVEHEEDLGSW